MIGDTSNNTFALGDTLINLTNHLYQMGSFNQPCRVMIRKNSRLIIYAEVVEYDGGSFRRNVLFANLRMRKKIRFRELEPSSYNEAETERIGGSLEQGVHLPTNGR